MAQALVFSAILLAFSGLISLTAGAVPTCTADPAPATDSVTCDGKGAAWPVAADLTPWAAVPLTTKTLRLHNMVITDDAAATPLLATLTALTGLHFKNVQSNAPSTGLPIQQLIAPLPVATKAAIVHLSLHQVTVSQVVKEVLAGLTGLVDISIDGTGVTDIAANSLETVTKLQKLTIQSETKLTKFPWAVLTPSAAAFQTLFLNDLSALTEITAPAAALALPALKGISVIKTGLTTVPAALTASLPTATTGQTKVDVVFTDSANPCTNCDLLKPLIHWAQAAGTAADSQLSVSCKASNGQAQTVTRSAADWKGKADCVPDVLSTGTTFTSISLLSLLVSVFVAIKLF